jgi:hypothetical protein
VADQEALTLVWRRSAIAESPAGGLPEGGSGSAASG